MYFFIQNTEDGVRVRGPWSAQTALAEVNELTSEDYKPEARAVFVSTPPDDYTPTNHVFIISGECVIPTARKLVTEWEL